MRPRTKAVLGAALAVSAWAACRSRGADLDQTSDVNVTSATLAPGGIPADSGATIAVPVEPDIGDTVGAPARPESRDGGVGVAGGGPLENVSGNTGNGPTGTTGTNGERGATGTGGPANTSAGTKPRAPR